ncbi:hypothetical protein JCM17961_27550 [Endothiovibrio diazotrophicus]
MIRADRVGIAVWESAERGASTRWGQAFLVAFSARLIMGMVVHQAIDVYPPVEALANLAKSSQKGEAIIVLAIDLLAPISSRGYMVKGACEFNS